MKYKYLLQVQNIFNRNIISQTPRLVTNNTISRNMSARAMPLVDVWCQPPEQSFVENAPEVHRLMKISHSSVFDLIKRGVGASELIEMMDKANISKALLCAWSRPGRFIVSNEQISKYTQAYPDRFIGIGTVDLYQPMKAQAEMEKFVKEYNFKGIRILPWMWNLPPTTNLYYPLFAKCIELDIPFCTQVGHTGPLMPSEPGRPIPYIDEVALHFPDLKIVGGHIGYPWTEEMIALAWKHKNVYIDTSAYAPKFYPKELINFMNTYGTKKVMFGTNFPHLGWDMCSSQLDDLKLTEKAKEHFMWKNANKVFKLGMGDTDDAKL